ncbi:flagellar hook capping FlgD N-terminal domain-containing protein [Thermaerobacter subterraneus]|uniref:Flagellar hook capping protein n=1 Tax=Thermaerobacter subterraneus DSM 13965 TaxID=867903 RepID=K6NXT3_9FIRM|nr:flagellar hook capping FlgD N-terminal domain-containing protein [Thermaerobacter subterraneus]EKP93675.1 flagellar hook capping protein [Thermaerobacter subterraneus DSM 13965]
MAITSSTAQAAAAGSGPGSTGGAAGRSGPGGPGGLAPDAFFRLLAAQLRYQDPLQPMQDTAFVAQLAQLTQLEETRALRAALSGLSALPLLGRTVEITTAQGTRTGTVTGVRMDPAAPGLMIDGRPVAWADVLDLRLAGEAEPAGGPAGRPVTA